MKRFFNKWKNLKDSVKSSIAFAISSFFIKGITFLVTPLFTRILSIENYGLITNYNSWLSIIEIFALLGLTSAGVFNVGLNDYKDNRDEYIASCLGICNLFTIITFNIVIFLKFIVGAKFILGYDLIIIMFINLLITPAMTFWITRQKYEYKYRLATIITILSVIFGQLLSVLGVLLFKNNPVFFKVFGYNLGTLIFSIPIFIILIVKGKKYVNMKLWKSILILALPLIPHYLAQHMMASSDKIMITSMVSSGDAAIYGVVANIGVIGLILWNSINGSLVPYTFENIENQNYENINNVSKKIILIYFIFCIFLILIAPEILRILAPKEYYHGVYIVPPVVTVVFIQAIYNLFANVEFYHKKTKRIAFATVVAACVNFILNYIFIPKFSFVAAAYTTLASYIVLAVFHYIGYNSCSTEKIYNSKLFTLLLIILLFISGICSILYKSSNVIRYVIIALFLIISLINKNKIINILKEIK